MVTGQWSIIGMHDHKRGFIFTKLKTQNYDSNYFENSGPKTALSITMSGSLLRSTLESTRRHLHHRRHRRNVARRCRILSCPSTRRRGGFRSGSSEHSCKIIMSEQVITIDEMERSRNEEPEPEPPKISGSFR